MTKPTNSEVSEIERMIGETTDELVLLKSIFPDVAGQRAEIVRIRDEGGQVFIRALRRPPIFVDIDWDGPYGVWPPVVGNEIRLADEVLLTAKSGLWWPLDSHHLDELAVRDEVSVSVISILPKKDLIDFDEAPPPADESTDLFAKMRHTSRRIGSIEPEAGLYLGDPVPIKLGDCYIQAGRAANRPATVAPATVAIPASVKTGVFSFARMIVEQAGLIPDSRADGAASKLLRELVIRGITLTRAEVDAVTTALKGNDKPRAPKEDAGVYKIIFAACWVLAGDGKAWDGPKLDRHRSDLLTHFVPLSRAVVHSLGAKGVAAPPVEAILEYLVNGAPHVTVS